MMTSILKRVVIVLAVGACALATAPGGVAAQTFTDVTSAAGIIASNE